MIISTTNGIEGSTIAAYHGVVSGVAVLGTNKLQGAMGDMFNRSNRSTPFETAINDAREEALKGMIEKARATGGNAVIGVSISFGTIQHNVLFQVVTATGTVVTLDK